MVATRTGVPVGRNLLHDLHLAGGGGLGTDFLFEGVLDDVAIFREVLDTTQIAIIRSTGVSGFTGLPQPPDAPLAITGVSVSGGNLIIGGASGIVIGQFYHLESSTTLDSFNPIPGSNFTGGDPVPVVPMSKEQHLPAVECFPGYEIEVEWPWGVCLPGPFADRAMRLKWMAHAASSSLAA
ncbi:hypothetical protein OKA05_20820 [Luteolibacter arcticus]|uniref:Uncharacterized protein n=1 Tax=Luteolibacter arcticus TaxID=1581411 RepID=A0ABT3GNC7_9BACT|nr:hypothetical protein [Luteolibacter arcticus]MCW1925018.1 hypothetical protein [Luteolibacter arcticus]